MFRSRMARSVPITGGLADRSRDWRVPVDGVLCGYGRGRGRTVSGDLIGGTGWSPGDVIYSVHGAPVSTHPALRTSDKYKPGFPPMFQIERCSRLMFVAVELE